ncbi:MAG: hypothetical protein SCK57_12465 [Bacillota bacterium]|nr:hypothetical protein [Bacillota bacterium]
MKKPINEALLRELEHQKKEMETIRHEAFTTWLEDLVANSRLQPRDQWLYFNQIAGMINLSPSSFSKRMHHNILFNDLQMTHLAARFGKNLEDIITHYLHEDSIDTIHHRLHFVTAHTNSPTP